MLGNRKGLESCNEERSKLVLRSYKRVGQNPGDLRNE